VGGDGRVWIGTLNARVEVHAAGSDARSIDIANLPLRMVEARGAIWIGSSNGLLRLDPDTESIRRYAHDPSDPESLGRGWAWSVHEDRRGRLWVGTGEGGLHRLLDDGRFAHYTHEAENPASLSDNYVTVIGEAPDGRLWVGTRSGGLNAFDPERSEFRRFLPDPADDMSLSHHSVSAILFDGGGSMWVGTAGGGLNHAVKDARGEVTGFERITEREGLISNNVVSLLEDEDGSLWIGTRRGLSRFDPADGRFVNYGTADGLASAEMTAGAAAAGRDSLYFGTHRGVTAVRKGTPFPDVAPSPTVVTAIRIVGGRQPAERPAPIDPDFTIPWGRILSFEFSVLDYGDRRRHRYQYRISGRRDEWIDLGSRHEITFADLDPGRYDLSVRGRNDQGVWSELDQPIRIEVVPPFWMTTWFRFLIVASIVGAAIGSHQFRMTRLARRNRELEDLKNQREMALEEARKSQEALHGAYDRLRRLTRRLEVAKEEERKHLARELHDEMGQALTTAKLNLQLFSGSEGLEDRNRRVTETLSLLDRMIVHVRALSLDLRPPLLDELGLSAALRGYTEALTRRSGVRVDLVIDSIPRDVPTEVEIAAFRVVQESLTNVLRHSGARRAEVNVRYDPSGFELRVEDDGRGFDVGAALERAVGGEHVGLLGMRERVESMGGALTVDSAPGTGTRIQARIPVAL
jgi:signal transduction histidine kinase/streptogramin lyase